MDVRTVAMFFLILGIVVTVVVRLEGSYHFAQTSGGNDTKNIVSTQQNYATR